MTTVVDERSKVKTVALPTLAVDPVDCVTNGEGLGTGEGVGLGVGVGVGVGVGEGVGVGVGVGEIKGDDVGVGFVWDLRLVTTTVARLMKAIGIISSGSNTGIYIKYILDEGYLPLRCLKNSTWRKRLTAS